MSVVLRAASRYCGRRPIPALLVAGAVVLGGACATSDIPAERAAADAERTEIDGNLDGDADGTLVTDALSAEYVEQVGALLTSQVGLDADEADCVAGRFGDVVPDDPAGEDPQLIADEFVTVIRAATSACITSLRVEELEASLPEVRGPVGESRALYLTAARAVSDEVVGGDDDLVAAGHEVCRLLGAIGVPMDAVPTVLAGDPSLAADLANTVSAKLGTVLGSGELIAFVTVAGGTVCV